MNAPITNDADIGRVLFEHVVKPRKERPHLEITTSKGVFHLVAVEELIFQRVAENTLTFIVFTGKQPIGRSETFIWPPYNVEGPARGIIALQVYGQ